MEIGTVMVNVFGRSPLDFDDVDFGMNCFQIEWMVMIPKCE